ncbi:M23 family metallopeptidase [Desulfofarcimen acetoxidans]|uniref:M23 family metallopeptidase n=1 Tax=Desulfofarcimen acetoxidans TaxID=58138 RepID=UPI00019E6693|nr:M23 family metallopeptidase [Desulfofarcimen acetoxidans]
MFKKRSGIEVNKGDIIKAGQVLGFVGSTGNSTGPHLHFGVYVNGTATDPEQWLKEQSKANSEE